MAPTKMINRRNAVFYILFLCLYLSVGANGFDHKPFHVERFNRINDDNALKYPSTNIQHCLGLFLRFCKTVSVQNKLL